MTREAPESDAPTLGAPVPADWSARAPEHVPLHGTTLSLLPLEPARDGPPLFALTHGTPLAERIWTWLPYGPFEDAAQLVAWMEQASAGMDPLFYAVTDHAHGGPVGVTSFLAIEPAGGSIELGHIWYAPAWQRGRTNTEACFLLMREAFARGFRRVEWKCDSLNAASGRAALRLGFRFEGTFRKHRVVKGRNRDTDWYSLLDDEWPATRAALERWLAWEGPDRPSLPSLREERPT